MRQRPWEQQQTRSVDLQLFPAVLHLHRAAAHQVQLSVYAIALQSVDAAQRTRIEHLRAHREMRHQCRESIRHFRTPDQVSRTLYHR